MDMTHIPQDAAITGDGAALAPLPGYEAQCLVARARALRARTLARLVRRALHGLADGLRAGTRAPFSGAPAR